MTEADWIKIIREFPADPFHRLGFSDWLEDRGDGERAELVRQTCKGERRTLGIITETAVWKHPTNFENISWKPVFTLRLRNPISIWIWIQPNSGHQVKVNKEVVDVNGNDGTHQVCLWNCKVVGRYYGTVEWWKEGDKTQIATRLELRPESIT